MESIFNNYYYIAAGTGAMLSGIAAIVAVIRRRYKE